MFHDLKLKITLFSSLFLFGKVTSQGLQKQIQAKIMFSAATKEVKSTGAQKKSSWSVQKERKLTEMV